MPVLRCFFFLRIFYTTFHASAFNPCKINFWIWCDIESWISLLFSIYVYLVVLPTFFFPLDCYCQKSIDAVSVCLSEKAVAPHSDTLAWKTPWRRSLVGCRPRGRWESDRPKRLPFTFHFHALEKEMATHSSVLAWRITGTGEAGGLPSMGSHKVGHDWSNLAAATTVFLFLDSLFCLLDLVFLHQ